MRLLPTCKRVAIVSCITAVSSCALNPEGLARPREITCLELSEPLSFTGHHGILNYEWTTVLAQGAYLSERADEKGIYYRAPAGGISITHAGSMPMPGQPVKTDGGIYVPNNATEPVRIYRYFSTAEAPTDASGAESTCSTLAYTKDPAGKKVNIVLVASAGALGGAAGGVVGRGVAKGSSLSYGQAAGAGAAGGMIGGFIVAAFINADVGKIVDGMPIQDAKLMGTLRGLAADRKTLHELESGTHAAPGAD